MYRSVALWSWKVGLGDCRTTEYEENVEISK